MSIEQIKRNNMVALAKRRKANKRSQMLKMIMPLLSHDNGEALSIAIANKNVGKFKAVWDNIKKELVNKLEHFKSESSGFDADEFYADMLESLSADHALLSGSGEMKDELRTFISEGVVQLTKRESLRIVFIETQTKSKSMLTSISYKVRTEIYNAEEDSVVKTFNGVGKLAEVLFDQLMLAKAYL